MDTSCSFPTANVSLRTFPKQLMSGQVYRVSLILEMPESPVNKDLGVFMVKLTFASKENYRVTTSSRPAILRHKSWLLHFFSTTFFAMPLLTGFSEEKQTIKVDLFENFLEDTLRPAAYAQVELQALNIEIYSASLIINARFSGLRYFMYNWPLTAGILGVLGNFIMISILLLLLWDSIFEVVQRDRIFVPISENNLSNVERMLTDLDRSYLPVFCDSNSDLHTNIANAIVNISNTGLIPAVRFVSLSANEVRSVLRSGDHQRSSRRFEENDIESISSTNNIDDNSLVTDADNEEKSDPTRIQSMPTVGSSTQQDESTPTERNDDDDDNNLQDTERQIRDLDGDDNIIESQVSESVLEDNDNLVLRRRQRASVTDVSSNVELDSEESSRK
ncbi:uncharacterized protein TRIADDRAFT_59236 [Trichoplax adhaerens]|uniref:Seipin n=1 Tax=Trichoplax adhaerens TaxID=10228 RepID=B3S587_TRIAD|nr:hypothetical protein TRIADDRAFT_59236 [Trichoplax adhaerens]EDV22094.1 hypothetical protein TRIADDRAFT_59236 [Trichoplax adhaerens]|eukprot:XP_002115249.1 hypothetical protein TRIADDRAFT_59236 [Trichoplax adhaerens]